MFVNSIEKNSSFSRFYFLLGAKFLSDMGIYLNTILFSLYMLELTSSAVYVSLVLGLDLIGGALAAPFIGIIADIWNRKTLMIIADCIRAVVMLALVLSPVSYHVSLLLLASFIVGVFKQQFKVSLRAAIPNLISDENRIRGNALLNSCEALGVIVGCIGSGFFISMLEVQMIFLFGALTYIFSGLILSCLPLHTNKVSEKRLSFTQFIEDSRCSLDVLKFAPVLFAFLFIRLIDAFGSGAHRVGMSMYSAELDPENPAFILGFIYASWGIGKFCALPWTKNWLENQPIPPFNRSYILSTMLMSSTAIVLFCVSSTAAIVMVAVTMGFADGISYVCLDSKIQERPDSERGKFFGLASMLEGVGLGLSLVLCGPLFELFPIYAVVACFHAMPLLVCFFYYKRWFLTLRQA